MKALFLALSLALAGPAFAQPMLTDGPQGKSEIPTTEKEFVEGIKTVNKDQILEQFGEPHVRDDVVTPDGEVIASVWHYRYLNTDESGSYYKTTELDFVRDKVVMVVFMNHDIADEAPPSREYDVTPKLDPSQDPDLLEEIEPQPYPAVPQYEI
ncbi:MAG TPA: hypothetical protein VD810_03005 [Methylophilaceae bacterium]|nr:hypothetical protein [Methylophilaceae bacterium]